MCASVLGAGYPNGKVSALDIEDGKLTWEASVSQPHGATELERIADVAGLPVVEGGQVCAAAFQGKVACFEIQSRNLVWARDVSSTRALARDSKNIYVVDDASAVHALDKAQGASLWKQEKLVNPRLTPPAGLDRPGGVARLQGSLPGLPPATGDTPRRPGPAAPPPRHGDDTPPRQNRDTARHVNRQRNEANGHTRTRREDREAGKGH